jgi:hypothetical protein
MLQVPEKKVIFITPSLTCSPLSTPIGVMQVSCSNAANKILIKLTDLAYGLGEFEFKINGIQNPSSFKQAPPMQLFYLFTSDYYNITSVNKDQLAQNIIKNNQTALIQIYSFN